MNEKTSKRPKDVSLDICITRETFGSMMKENNNQISTESSIKTINSSNSISKPMENSKSDEALSIILSPVYDSNFSFVFENQTAVLVASGTAGFN
ncbi:hypothetical protein AYI68_g3760 [Smittium mucronatum]|uniref:Uncharacterized protein n=1 Tax=Smittium mucronatum TaxID=133383 RepID=A0A1R0GZ14_9FUNG|nr:hypothetical protein AYI68_g3760 [Smittium mucronatum]